MLLVVVKDLGDGLDAGVLLAGVVGARVLGLVPVKDTADEGGDEVSTGLGGSDGLDRREKESKVAVDAVVALKNLGGLDTLPHRGDLNQDTVLRDALLLVQLQWCHVSICFIPFEDPSKDYL